MDPWPGYTEVTEVVRLDKKTNPRLFRGCNLALDQLQGFASFLCSSALPFARDQLGGDYDPEGIDVNSYVKISDGHGMTLMVVDKI